MSRSVWKVLYQANSVLRTKSNKIVNQPKIWSRSSVICKEFVWKKVLVHNGNKFIAITIKPEMVGHKFGEFAFTKRLGRTIHNLERSKGVNKSVKKK